MSNTRFSPGPWDFWNNARPETEEFNCVTPDIDETHGIGWYSKSINISDSKGKILADIKAMTTGSFLHSFKEWEANCHLIKAAPKMYESLEKCLNIFQQLADSGRYPEPMMAANGGSGFGFITEALNEANPKTTT